MANNRFKVDNGLAVSGNAEFYQRIDAHANAHFNNDLFVVSGNLVVNGTLIYANVVIGNGGIRAVADQQDLGNTQTDSTYSDTVFRLMIRLFLLRTVLQ